MSDHSQEALVTLWIARFGIKLRNENHELEDVTDEIVIDAQQYDNQTHRLELSFGRRGARSGFVGHKYSVNVPSCDISRIDSPHVDFGFQFRGVIAFNGTIVINDPITRQKPLGDRATYEAA